MLQLRDIIWEPELQAELDDFDPMGGNNISICCSGGGSWYGVDFILNGGEPMLYYKITELLEFMNTMDIRINCFMSGYGITNYYYMRI